ncbi:hypothetical protein QJQ45_012710 [Haematococcus lacustris]|nr:hypothetical protein QJQ45_012710 [Haematococcus lacustris]
MLTSVSQPTSFAQSKAFSSEHAGPSRRTSPEAALSGLNSSDHGTLLPQPAPVSVLACIATLWTHPDCPESDWLLVNSECWTPGNHSLTQAMTQAGSQVGKAGHAVQDVVLMHMQQNTIELMDLFMEDVLGQADQSMEMVAAGGGQAQALSTGTEVPGSSDAGSILFIDLSST